MQIDYLRMDDFVVVETRRAVAGTILFQSAYQNSQPPRLIALSHVQDGDDESHKIYVELTQGAPGFQVSDARLANIDLGVIGWRVELAPTSAKSTSAGRPRAGDIVMHQGLLSLVVWDERGRPYSLDFVDFTLAPPPADDVTTIFFTGWRIVTDVDGQTEPVVVFERSPPTR